MGKKANRLIEGPGDRRLRGSRVLLQGPVLLACEKCERRLAKEGRFRQITQMRQAMEALATEVQTSGSELRIFPVPCMDVCPKGAMAVAHGNNPADVLIVRTPADLISVCEDLVQSAVGTIPPVEGVDDEVASSNAR